MITNPRLFEARDEEGLEFGRALIAIRRHLGIIGLAIVVCAGGAAIQAQTQAPIYKGSFELLTEATTLESKIISSTNEESLSNRPDVVSLVLDAVELRVLSSPYVLNPVIRKLQLEEGFSSINYRSLTKNLKLIPDGNGRILRVEYSSRDRQQTSTVLAMVGQAYLDYSREKQQQDIKKGIDFVEDQIPQQSQRVTNIRDELETIRREYAVVNPSQEGEKLAQQLIILEQRQLENDILLREKQSLYGELRQQYASRDLEDISATAISTDPYYQKLMAQLQQIDQELAKQSVLFLENSPEIRYLQEQRQKTIPLLQEAIAKGLSTLETQIAEIENNSLNLQAKQQEIKEAVAELSGVIRNFQDKEQELAISSDNLIRLREKREALRLDAAQREIPWEVLIPVPSAEQLQGETPSARQNTLLGAILGVMVGTGISILIDRLGNLLYSSEEVKAITKLPVLGVVPRLSYLQPLVANVTNPEGAFSKTTPSGNSPQRSGVSLSLDDDGDFDDWNQEAREPWFTGFTQKMWGRDHFRPGGSPSKLPPIYDFKSFLESFYSLGTNIRFLGIDRPIQSIVVSSSIPGEGKTTVAAHLAYATALSGQKVLLVDCDLRRPRMGEELGISPQYGFSDIVSQNIATEYFAFTQMIPRIPFEKNLYFLGCGTHVPDPIRILASKRLPRLMKTLTKEFDLIIYDTPPMLGLADTQLLAAHTDGIVLTVGLGQIKRSLLEEMMYKTRVGKLNLLGVVANGSQDLPSQRAAYPHYYYQTPSSPS